MREAAVIRDLRAVGTVGEAGHLAFLEAVVDATLDGVFGVDDRGLITSWNPGAERIFGCAKRDVLGQPVQSVFPTTAHETLNRLLGAVGAGDRIERFPIDVQRPGGMPTPVVLTLCAVTTAHGAVVGTAAIARDLTEQRLTQAALAEIEALRQEGEALTHSGRWLWDVQSGAVQWSEEVHRIHGVDPWDFGGDFDAHLALVAGHDRARVAAALREAAAAARGVELEYQIVRPDDVIRQLRASASPALGAGGVVVGLTGVLRDVSEDIAAGH